MWLSRIHNVEDGTYFPSDVGRAERGPFIHRGLKSVGAQLLDGSTLTVVVVAEHRYEIDVAWSGETTDYHSYSRNHEVHSLGHQPIPASADPVIGRGDATRWNPEQLLVAAVSQCHMLWYLHLCVNAGIVVVDYRDTAVGIMSDTRFTSVTLRPRVWITSADRADDAQALHREAHQRCFIANSVNFPVTLQPRISVKPG